MTCPTIPSNTIYMDYSATHPLLPCVKEAVQEYLNLYGNPSSIYSVGRFAKQVLEESRATIAKCLNCDPEEIFFTSGGTESDNWAISTFRDSINEYRNKHIFVSAIEHHAILNSVSEDKDSFSYVVPDEQGYIHSDSLNVAVRNWSPYVGTSHGLVSIMLANNEIGTIQNIKALARIAHDCKYFFHTDAVQAVGTIPVDIKELDVDMLSLSGHKFGALKGIGALYMSKSAQKRLSIPLIRGGHQEKGMRAGTENVLGALSMAVALEHKCANMEETAHRVSQMRDWMQKNLSSISGTFVNGVNRLPGNLNITFDGVEGESLVIDLALHKICVSQGSACNSGSLVPSHVLKAIGRTDDQAHSTIRISLGEFNTQEECAAVCKEIEKSVNRIRKSSNQ